MSSDNSSDTQINLFFAPFGILQNEREDQSKLSSISQKINKVREGHGEEIKPLTDALHHHAKDLNSLYDYISKPEKWQKIRACSNTAYQIETESAVFTITVRPMPDGFIEKPYGHFASRYVFMELYSKNTDITSIYGLGFYTENPELTDHSLGELLVSYVKHWMQELANEKPDFLEKLAEKAVEKKLKKLEDKVIKKVEQEVGDIVPGWVVKAISFAMDPTFDNAVNIAETTIISLMPTVVGKILAYVAFEVLNYLFTNEYKIRYAIINRTNNSFEMSNYYDYFSTNLPSVLKSKSSDNILHRTHQTPMYYSQYSDTPDDWVWVMQAPSFDIGNETDCPSALIRLKNFAGDTETNTNYHLENIMSMYDIIYTDDNKQGLALYGKQLPGSGEDIYYELRDKDSDYKKYFTVDTDEVLITQGTNALSGLDDPTYDVVLIVDEKSGQGLN